MQADIDYRRRGTFYTCGDDDPWFCGVPYTGNGFSIGRHATQPEHRFNAKFLKDEDGKTSIGLPLQLNCSPWEVTWL